MSKIKSILAFAALMLCGGAWAGITVNGSNFTVTNWESSNATTAANRNGYSYGPDQMYFVIPSTEGMPVGSIVRLMTLKIAEPNDSMTDANTTKYIYLNGKMSGVVNGTGTLQISEYWGRTGYGEKQTFTFEGGVDLVVGTSYRIRFCKDAAGTVLAAQRVGVVELNSSTTDTCTVKIPDTRWSIISEASGTIVSTTVEETRTITANGDTEVTITEPTSITSLTINGTGNVTIHALDANGNALLHANSVNASGLTGKLTIDIASNETMNAGANELVYNFYGEMTATEFTHTGAFTKGGTGTVAIHLGMGSASMTVTNGILKRPSGNNENNNDASQDWNFNNKTVTVKDGATFDLNGGKNKYIKLVIEGNGFNNKGAVCNSVANTATSNTSIAGITLEGDAKIDLATDYAFVSTGYAIIPVELGAYTLTKTGAGKMLMTNVKFTGTGTAYMAEGEFKINDNSKGEDFVPEGTLEVGANTGFASNGKTFKVKNLKLHSRRDPGASAGTIKVPGLIDLSACEDIQLNQQISSNGILGGIALTVYDTTSFIFPSWWPTSSMKLSTNALNLDNSVSGGTAIAPVYKGDTAFVADLTYNTTDKTVSYEKNRDFGDIYWKSSSTDWKASTEYASTEGGSDSTKFYEGDVVNFTANTTVYQGKDWHQVVDIKVADGVTATFGHDAYNKNNGHPENENDRNIESGSTITLGTESKALFSYWGGSNNNSGYADIHDLTINGKDGSWGIADAKVTALRIYGKVTGTAPLVIGEGHSIQICDGGSISNPIVSGADGKEVAYNATTKTYSLITAVAKVGSLGYETLSAAISAAAADETVELLANSTETITLTKDLVISVADGKELSVGTISSNYNVTKKGAGTLTMTHNVDAEKFVDVVEGTLKMNLSANYAMKGRLYVRADAKFVNMRTDAFGIDTDGARADIYGTLDMNGTRWTLGRGDNANDIYFYPGSSVIGLGQEQYGALDNASAGKTHLHFVKNGDEGGEVTFDTEIRFRGDNGYNAGMEIEEGMTVNYVNANGFRSGQGTLNLTGGGTFKAKTGASLQNLSTLNIGSGVTAEIDSGISNKPTIRGAGTFKLAAMPDDSAATAYGLTDTGWTGTVDIANEVVNTTSTPLCIKLEKLGNASSTILWHGDRATGTGGLYLTGGTDAKVAAKIKLAGDFFFNNGGSNVNYYLGEIDGNNDSDGNISFLTWRNNDGVGASYHVDKLSNFAGKITATRYTTISELALNSMPTANQKILTFGTPNDSYHTSKDSFAITSITVNGEVKDLAYEIRQDDGVYIVAVALVGDNTYLSFAEAFEAAGEGGTVKLAGNTSASISIPAGKKLDVNGYVASGAITYGEGAYLIENGKPKINGCATNFDLTFNGNTTIDYTTVGGTVGLNGTASYKADNQAISLLNRPWVNDAGSFFDANQLTLAMAGVMPEGDNKIFMHMGSAKGGKYGVYLATGTKADEVIIGWNYNNEGHTITTMTVPNARTDRHCYIITKNDVSVGENTTATFTIYLDGLKWKTFVPDQYFRITGGFQVGSCYEQLVSGYNFADGENSYVNFFRAYQRIISKAEIDAYAEAYPYTSPNGTYERTITANGNWVAENAWTSGDETTDKPSPNGNVVLTANNEAATTAVTVNLSEEVEYEKLTLSGTEMSFARADDSAKSVKAVCTVIGAPVTLNHRAVVLTAGPTIIVEGGSLTFDFSGLTSDEVAANHAGHMTMAVTGEMDQQEVGVVSLTSPTDAGIKSAEIVYNRNHYEVVVRNRAAKVVGETTQYFDTIEAAINAAGQISDVVIIDGSKVLPDGYRNYAVADDGHIVTTVNARTETKGFVSLAAAAAYCVEGDVIELLADDTSAVVLNKDITINISDNRTISGVISGNYSITKTGSSTLTLSGANTFTGLNVNAGTVKGGASANKSATPFGSLAGTITIADGATLDIDKATLGTDNTNNDFGYTIVSNGGTITKSTANGDNAYSKLIKSLTLNKDMTISGNTIGVGVKSSNVQGAIVLNGHTLTVNMSGEWNNTSGLGNFYLYNVEVSGSGTINVVKGNLLTHTVGSTATNAKLIIGSHASTQIEAELGVKELEIKSLNNKTPTQNLTVSSKITVDVNSAYTLNAKVVPAETCEWVIKEGTTLTVSGDRTTQGINGGGTLINTSGDITAKNKPSGYAVDDATVQIDGGTFTVYLGNGDPQIRNAKFVINGGELKTHGWITMVGTIELDAASDTTIFGSSTYDPSFRGTPNIIKSGDGNVTIKAGVDTGARFSSLTLNGGSLTLTADVTVDSLVSGVAHKTVHYDSTTRTYSLVGPIATVDGVDCFTKEDLAAHPQGTLVILNSDRVTIDGNQVLVDGEALSAVTVEEMVLSPTAEETPGLRISEICPKLSLWDENHRDAGWLEVVNNGTAYANLKDYNIARFNRGKEVKKVTDWKCGVDVWIAPGERVVIKTSEDYPNAADKQITRYGADLNNALVLGAKINPKKYPVVVLAKGKTTIQKCVVPVDVPENKSVCYDGALKNGATVSYITTATKGTANDFTNAVAVGPQVTSLYGVADAPDPWIAFPKATKDAPYSVTLPVNPVYGVEENEANSITKVQLIYQIGFATPVTNDTEMVKSAEKDATKGWLYTGTIPASALTEDGQVVKFAVKITDGAGNEWRSPSFNNPEDGFQWYGTIIEPTAEQTDGGITTLHIFADPDEVADKPGSSDRPATDPLMNIDADDASYKTQNHPYGAYVGIYDNDTGMYYDSVRIDKRGNTTGKFTKKAHGLKFAKAQPFTGKDSVSGKTIECRKSSFTAEYADPAFVRQELSFKMMNDNGSPAPFHYPVRLNLNGEFYQLAFHTERFSDELIEDFYGLDPKGYGYKNIGPFNMSLGSVSGGIEKKTPDDGVTSDNGVLDAFCRKMEACELISEAHTEGNPTPTADSEFETEFSAELTKVVTTDFDLPAWLNYIALTKITGETDDVWANLSGYYDVNGTGTWMPLAYDMNQSFGQWHKSDDPNMVTEMANAGKNCANYDHFKAHPLYGGLHIMVHYSGGAPYSAANNGTTARKSYKGNRCYEAIFQNAKYRRLYLRRLRTLMDAEFGGASADQDHTPVYQRAKEMVKRYSAVAAKDREIWTNYETSAQELWVFGHKEAGWTAEDGLEWMWTNYIEPRREHLYVTHAAANHTAAQIGYGETLCAGIPAAQSSIDTLKGNFAVEWDDAHQAVVLKNKNAEAVDVSGWAVAGRIAFVFPAGTVIDQGTAENPGTLYITADRKATVASFGNDLHDQIIIGNGTANADVDAIVVRTNTGLRILGEATDQETSIRFESIYGNTNVDADGDEGEWFTLKNVGETSVNLEGMTICILKDDAKSTEADGHCHITFDSKSKVGSLGASASKTFNQADWASKGWSKIQNNKLIIKLYDKYGINYQTLKVTQKDYPMAYGKGAFLEYSEDKWKQVWNGGDVTVKGDYLNKDLYVRAAEDMTLTLDNPTYKSSSTLKISGEGTVTITGTLDVSGVKTAIKSSGDLVFADGSYTITASDDCIQADGDITINGGTFICHSTGNDGIDSNQNIVINGGTIYAFTAATEEDTHKSTGLDVNEGHSITINGGTVIATSLSKKALEDLTIADGSQVVQIVEVSDVSSATKAIGDVIVTFPTMEVSPTAVLVSTPNLTEEEITPAEPGTVEIVAEDAEAGTDAVRATVPVSWVAEKEGDAKVAAAEAFVLGLAEPTEKPVVSSEQTAEADSIRIVDNVAPRFGTGVTVKRTLFVGTTPGEEEADTSIEETNGGFTVPLPTGSDKVKYLKIKYSFE